ncbi:hypothetical protein BC628DRAFT_1095195 [Trametes gibbosa]|nr:hypothetical protein BC628DRAFT_1095195 [Trametes gibbosa]
MEGGRGGTLPPGSRPLVVVATGARGLEPEPASASECSSARGLCDILYTALVRGAYTLSPVSAGNTTSGTGPRSCILSTGTSASSAIACDGRSRSRSRSRSLGLGLRRGHDRSRRLPHAFRLVSKILSLSLSSASCHARPRAAAALDLSLEY